MMKRSSFGLLSLGLLLAVTSIGCGGGSSDMPEVGTVTGKVMLDGEPVSGAEISFYPLDGGRTAVAISDADGGYVLRYNGDTNGAKVGRNQVSVTTAKEQEGDKGDAGYVPAKQDTISTKYNDGDGVESTLEVDVDPGDNVIDLDLKSEI